MRIAKNDNFYLKKVEYFIIRNFDAIYSFKTASYMTTGRGAPHTTLFNSTVSCERRGNCLPSGSCRRFLRLMWPPYCSDHLSSDMGLILRFPRVLGIEGGRFGRATASFKSQSTKARDSCMLPYTRPQKQLEFWFKQTHVVKCFHAKGVLRGRVNQPSVRRELDGQLNTNSARCRADNP